MNAKESSDGPVVWYMSIGGLLWLALVVLSVLFLCHYLPLFLAVVMLTFWG